jgi:anti-anti-sigma factor
VKVTEADFHDDGDGLVTVSGEIDLANAHELTMALAAAGGNVRVDCAKLTFIDSSGVRAFVQAGRRAQVALLNVPPNMKRTLEVLGLSEWLTDAGDSDEPMAQA